MFACKFIFSIVQRPWKKSIKILLIFCDFWKLPHFFSP